MKQYDAIIIGFGAGGKSLAIELARHEWSVLMVERSNKMYGGSCPNVACIPTKFLIHQAQISAYNDPRTPLEKANDYLVAIEKKNQLTSFLRQKNYDKLASNKYITVYNGIASFTSPDTIFIESDYDTTEVKGKYIFIDTGSETVIPNISGIKDSLNVYTSTSLLQLKELPKNLAIIGGGYIGLEFATIYSEFGSKVTVLEQSPNLIPKEDRDIAYSVKESMEKKGISFKIHVSIQSVYDTANGTTITYKNEKDDLPYYIEADAVLVATGRKPNTYELNLDAAGIQTDSRGAIITDEYLHTNIPRIYALGDVRGELQFTYISSDDFRIIRDELFGNRERTTKNRGPIPYSVFIEPPLSRVGLSEEEALKQGMDIKVAKLSASEFPRARTLNETDGMLKAIIDARNNKIIGSTLFCADSNEVINFITMAIKMELDYTCLRDFIFTHPSMCEALNRLFSRL